MNLLKKLNIKYNSPVILSFVFISALALLLSYITRYASNFYLFSVHRGSLINPLFYIRLFTHVLGHANLSHYTNNMLLILLVGPMLEEKYGSKNILIIIMIVGFITGLVNVTFTNNILLGASGVVFAFILLASITGNINGGIPLTLIIVTVIYLGEQIYQAIYIQDNVSQLTHIIGGIIGLIIGLSLQNKKHISA